MLRHRLVICSVVALVVFALVYALNVSTTTAVAQPEPGSRVTRAMV